MSQNFINNDVWVNLNSNNFVFNKLDFRGRGKKKKVVQGLYQVACREGRVVASSIIILKLKLKKKKPKTRKDIIKI